MSRPGAMSLLVLLGALTPTPVARAVERATAAVKWQDSGTAAGCLDREALVRAVEQRLQRKVFVSQADADLLITVGSAREGSQAWTIDLDLSTRAGQHLGHRTLTTRAPHCSALDDSLALVVALMVDVSRADVRIETEKPALSPPTPLEVPPTTAAPREPWHAVVALRGVGTIGKLPGLGHGIRLASEIRPPGAWSVEFGVTAWADQTLDAPPGRATFSLFTAELAICATTLRVDAADLAICAGQQVGFEHATARGFDLSRDEATMVYDLFGKFRVGWWPLQAFGVNAALGFAVPLVRDEFFAVRADGAKEQLFRPAPVAALAEAGLGLRW